jgi:hypothetical protein
MSPIVQAWLETLGVVCLAVIGATAGRRCSKLRRPWGGVGYFVPLPFIAVVKYAFLIDHFVTILEVRDSTVVIGDPLAGRMEMMHGEFAKKWRHCGIEFETRADR